MEQVTWLDLLRAEADQTSINKAAQKIGYKRPSISLALSGKYPGDTKRIEAAVLKHLSNQIVCPFYKQAIPLNECVDSRSRPMPTSNPTSLRLWRTCQNCQNNKEKNDA